MDKLNIIVMTQNEAFFIPRNIRKISSHANVLQVVEVDCKSSLNNRFSDYFKWFGVYQCGRMGVKKIWRTLQELADRLSGYRLLHGECSVKDVARANGFAYLKIHDSNAPDYIENVRRLQPDLIISYSAPQIIREELLSIPRFGILNVHGSLLPDYRGCMPSFWYLYNEEKVGGATVHYMSAKIDDGDIVEQGSVDISDCRSMFQLMRKTKELGGELMIQAVEHIAAGTAQRKPNISSEGRYFVWPTREQGKEFRKKGFRLY